MITIKQKRIIALLVVVVTLVNLGALATIFYQLREVKKIHEVNSDNLEVYQPDDAAPAFMMREIGFDARQRQQIHKSKQLLSRDVMPLLVELRRLNAELTEEVMRSDPDTLKLNLLCDEIGNAHARMKRETTHHLLDIKHIASPVQNQKLKDFYREMLNRGQPQPDGRMHRHRRGWNNAPLQ